MPRLKIIPLAFILTGFLAGCAAPGNPLDLLFGPQVSPSPAFSPTPPGDPGTAQPSLEPSATPTETVTPVPATLDPALLNPLTPTPTPTLNPNDMLLRIAVPGPMSKVVSPIDFVVYIAPDFTGSTRIQLFGEDGRELYSKAFRTFSNIDFTTRVEENVTFEIHSAAEIGRLQVSTIDRFGRLQALNSVRLLLQAVGSNQLTQAYPALERILLRTPRRGDEVRGGVLAVEGEILPINDSPLVLELYDDKGNVMGSRILTLRHVDGGYQPFNTTIPYQPASDKAPARLMIRQSDDRIGGLAYLYSVLLTIDP